MVIVNVSTLKLFRVMSTQHVITRVALKVALKEEEEHNHRVSYREILLNLVLNDKMFNLIKIY